MRLLDFLYFFFNRRLNKLHDFYYFLFLRQLLRRLTLLTQTIHPLAFVLADWLRDRLCLPTIGRGGLPVPWLSRELGRASDCYVVRAERVVLIGNSLHMIICNKRAIFWVIGRGCLLFVSTALWDLSTLLVKFVIDLLELSSNDLLLVLNAILFAYFKRWQLYVGSSWRFCMCFRLLTFEHGRHRRLFTFFPVFFLFCC